MNRDAVIKALNKERDQQDRKWGVQNRSDLDWLARLGEEFGELCNALVEGDLKNAKVELIQTMATCSVWLEDDSCQINQI